MFIGDLFLIEVSDGLLHPLGRRQRAMLYPASVFTGQKFLVAFMRLEFIKITTMSVQNSMFIWDLFIIDVSSGLLLVVARTQSFIEL